MHDHAVMVRLLVRAVGLAMLGLALPEFISGVAQGVATLAGFDDRAFSYVVQGQSGLTFYWWPIDLQYVTHWCLAFLLPSCLCLAGAFLARYGSRPLERRLTRALAHP